MAPWHVIRRGCCVAARPNDMDAVAAHMVDMAFTLEGGDLPRDHRQALSDAVERVLPIHQAQLLSYMKLLNVPVGLLINFNASKLTDGVSRLILPGANH